MGFGKQQVQRLRKYWSAKRWQLQDLQNYKLRADMSAAILDPNDNFNPNLSRLYGNFISIQKEIQLWEKMQIGHGFSFSFSLRLPCVYVLWIIKSQNCIFLTPSPTKIFPLCVPLCVAKKCAPAEIMSRIFYYDQLYCKQPRSMKQHEAIVATEQSAVILLFARSQAKCTNKK